jgi:hypothetical protein
MGLSGQVCSGRVCINETRVMATAAVRASTATQRTIEDIADKTSTPSHSLLVVAISTVAIRSEVRRFSVPSPHGYGNSLSKNTIDDRRKISLHDNYVSRSPPSLERCFSSTALNPSDSHEARECFVATRRAGRAERADRNSARRTCGIDSTGMRGTRPCLRFERKRVEAKSPTNTDIVSLRAPVRSFERTAARRDPEVIIRTRVAVMTRCTLLFQTRVIEPPSTLGSDNQAA